MLFFHTRARGFAQEPEEGLPPGDPGVRCLHTTIYIPVRWRREHGVWRQRPREAARTTRAARTSRVAASEHRGSRGGERRLHVYYPFTCMSRGGEHRLHVYYPLPSMSRCGEHRLHVEHLLVEVVLRVLRPACARGILIEVEQRGVLILQRLGRLDGPQRN